VIDLNPGPARGLLNKARSLQKFELVHLAPSPDLAEFVERFWLVVWDLPDQPAFTQENLPHPTQHLVIDPIGKTGIFGLMRNKFAYTLSRSGSLIGTKFRPAAFRRFFGRSVDAATDRLLPIAEVFGVDDRDLEAAFEALDDPADMADPIEAMLREQLPGPDPKALEVEAMVALIAATPEICSLAALAQHAGTSARTVQRLFEGYIGAGPKWVIDRYRMIEAVETLNANKDISLTELAHALGYFDQAHFSKAFLALTGKPPSSFKRDSEAAP